MPLILFPFPPVYLQNSPSPRMLKKFPFFSIFSVKTALKIASFEHKPVT